jgi:hypothetical protein
MPSPVSPQTAVRALEWSWDHASTTGLATLLTDDFLFACAASDSAGRAFRSSGITRSDLLEVARHLFTGGGSSPPASSIALTLDRTLFPGQDGRPGKQDLNFYREIVTSLVLRIETPEESFQITGEARLHLVRADVAHIPADLASHGAGPDPGRWYIERWEDETAGAGGASATSAAPRPRTLPAKNTTLCSLLELYR